MSNFSFYIVLIILLTTACARLPLKDPARSLRKYSQPLEFKDDLQKESLIENLKSHIDFFKKHKNPEANISFGSKNILYAVYIAALEDLVKAYYKSGWQGYLSVLKEKFEVHEVYGQEEYGDVFITSYYNPIIQASYKKKPSHSQPIYGRPKDLLDIKWDSFLDVFPKLKKYQTKVEAKSLNKTIRAKLQKTEDGKWFATPYESRELIDDRSNKYNSADVLAWVDPIDSFFMQIQGSGLLEFPDGKRHYYGYAAQNGHPYVAIGRFLTDIIPLEEMSMGKIDKHLRSLPSEELAKILNENPSYVFFAKLNGKPQTTLGTEVVPGRTIATDGSFFPKGALAYLEFEAPYWQGEELKYKKTSRFVMDQDTGGAIRGPGRLDLYWGEGVEAQKHAGVMKNRGRLYYLVPKSLKKTLPVERPGPQVNSALINN